MALSHRETRGCRAPCPWGIEGWKTSKVSSAWGRGWELGSWKRWSRWGSGWRRRQRGWYYGMLSLDIGFICAKRPLSSPLAKCPQSLALSNLYFARPKFPQSPYHFNPPQMEWVCSYFEPGNCCVLLFWFITSSHSHTWCTSDSSVKRQDSYFPRHATCFSSTPTGTFYPSNHLQSSGW